MTTMTVVQDGLLGVRRSVVDVRHWTLEKKMDTFWTRVSDNHDGCAGQTVGIMTVCLRCPLEDT